MKKYSLKDSITGAALISKLALESVKVERNHLVSGVDERKGSAICVMKEKGT